MIHDSNESIRHDRISFRPNLEALEDRTVLSAYINQGDLIVSTTNGNDEVRVQDYGSSYFRVLENGRSSWFRTSDVTTGRAIVVTHAGNDVVVNESSRLQLAGVAGDGNDVYVGGPGNDTVWGGNGDDVVHGQDGHDILLGENGNDDLYGGDHNDHLYGGNDHDGLFGGAGSNVSYGGYGSDRFLRWASDSIRDFHTSLDAVIDFVGSSQITTPLVGFGNVTFGAGQWTEAEILRADRALGNLHNHTGNTRLLKLSDGVTNLTFQRVGRQLNGQPGIGGWNNNLGLIAFTDASFNGLNNLGQNDGLNLEAVIYHEIGHNWDDPHENRHVPTFRRISGWVESYYRPSNDHQPSQPADDAWWYTGKAFARDYGAFNPQEDYATTFETYFSWYYHGTLRGNHYVADKWSNLHSLFIDLR